MSMHHKLLIIKDMNKHYVEVVCNSETYRVAMRFGRPVMIFDIRNKNYIKIPRNLDLLSILNYGIFKLLLDGVMMESNKKEYVYIVKTYPDESKLNWHADCLDYVEYIYGCIVQYDKKTDVYYIVSDIELDILECRNDDGVVARLQYDVDETIHVDDD